MTDKTKPSTVTLPGYTMVQLRQISAKRKKNKDLAWSQENIVISFYCWTPLSLLFLINELKVYSILLY